MAKNINNNLSQDSQDASSRGKKFIEEQEKQGGKLYSIVVRPERVADLISQNIALTQQLVELRIEWNKNTNKLEDIRFDENGQQILNFYELQNELNVNYYRDKENIETLIQENQDEINELSENYFGLFNPDREKKEKLSKEERREKRKKEKAKARVARRDLITALKEKWKRDLNKLETICRILSFIANNLLQKISINNGKIRNYVDQTNQIIQNAQTADDIITAKNARDSALLFISLNRNYLRTFEGLFSVIDRISSLLSAISNVLYLLPPPLYSPSVTRVITNIQEYLRCASEFISVGNTIIQSLLRDLDEQEARLLELNNILENNTDRNVSDRLSDSSSPYGYLSGYDYKGFKFYLKEEENPSPRNIINGRKRSYAVAVNLSGVEVLKSDYSFTLDPDVLVEQLKLEIDKQNLVA